MIQTRDMAFARGTCELIAPTSFEIQSNQLVAIIGPNGAGKSSLLSCLSGEYGLSKGEVLFGGTALPNWSAKQKAKQMAVLPQKSLLAFDFVVSSVVAMGRIPHQESSLQTDSIVSEVLVALDINHLAKRRYLQLSGGEQQRVQLARVMAQVWPSFSTQASLLLLDEPTASLDIDSQQRSLALIDAWVRQGNTAVIAMHDINLAAKFADQILVLRNGKILAFGNTDELLRPDLIKRAFDVDVEVIKHPKTLRPVIIF